jgi:hypothetical protein
MKKIPRGPHENRAPTRSEPEILEELVGRIRNIDRRFAELESEMRTLRQTPVDRSRRNRYEVEVITDMDTPLGSRGATLKLAPDSPKGWHAVPAIASALGLDPEGFGDTWYLLNANTGRVINSQDAQDIYAYFGDSPRVVKVTDFPF